MRRSTAPSSVPSRAITTNCIPHPSSSSSR
jgi:hypothetical protein